MRWFSIITVLTIYLSICRGQYDYYYDYDYGNGTDNYYDYGNGTDTILPEDLKIVESNSNDDCNLVWTSTTNPPLMLKDGKTIITESILKGRTLIFACPGEKNEFTDLRLKGEKSHSFICSQNGRFKLHPNSYILGSLACEKKITPEIIPNHNEKNCYKKESKDNIEIGNMYQIGYTYEGNQFYPIIDVCFDKEHETTIWTQHTLRRSIIPSASLKTAGIYRPDFKTSNGFFTVAMSRIYSQESQWDLFKKELDRQNVICSGIEGYFQTFLVKGHMSPKGDFPTKVVQDGTFFYINAMPQWMVINNGNWKTIEEKTRTLATTETLDLVIYTGGVTALEMKKKNEIEPEVKIFLSNVDDTVHFKLRKNKVPVPSITWKVVFDKEKNEGVAFVVINDPFPVPPQVVPRIRCTSYCGRIKWIKDQEKTLKETKLGLTHCCKIEDFINDYKEVGILPLIGTGAGIGLLGEEVLNLIRG